MVQSPVRHLEDKGLNINSHFMEGISVHLLTTVSITRQQKPTVVSPYSLLVLTEE